MRLGDGFHSDNSVRFCNVAGIQLQNQVSFASTLVSPAQAFSLLRIRQQNSFPSKR